jgi:hypothetical protein
MTNLSRLILLPSIDIGKPEPHLLDTNLGLPPRPVYDYPNQAWIHFQLL